MTGGNALYEQFRKKVVEPSFFASPYVVEHKGEPKWFGFVCRWRRRHRWTTWVRVEDAVKSYQSRVCRRCNLQQTEDLIKISLQDQAFVAALRQSLGLKPPVDIDEHASVLTIKPGEWGRDDEGEGEV